MTPETLLIVYAVLTIVTAVVPRRIAPRVALAAIAIGTMISFRIIDLCHESAQAECLALCVGGSAFLAAQSVLKALQPKGEA